MKPLRDLSSLSQIIEIGQRTFRDSELSDQTLQLVAWPDPPDNPEYGGLWGGHYYNNSDKKVVQGVEQDVLVAKIREWFVSSKKAGQPITRLTLNISNQNITGYIETLEERQSIDKERYPIDQKIWRELRPLLSVSHPRVSFVVEEGRHMSVSLGKNQKYSEKDDLFKDLYQSVENLYKQHAAEILHAMWWIDITEEESPVDYLICYR